MAAAVALTSLQASALAQEVTPVDLSVTLVDSPHPQEAGGQVTLIASITSDAVNTVDATSVYATLEPALRLIVVSVTPDQGTCTDTYPITCDLGTLAPDSSAEVTIVARAPYSGAHRSSVTVDLAEPDPDVSDNRDDTDTTIVPNEAGCTIVGTDGNDSLIGTEGDDVMCMGWGDDLARGGAGDDIIYGDGGHDTIHGHDGDDLIRGGWGEDNIRGNGGNDDIDGGRANDDVRGGGDTDTVRGGNGDDFVTGSHGFDTLEGGRGDDAIYAIDSTPGNDSIDGGEHHDECLADEGDTVTNCEA